MVTSLQDSKIVFGKNIREHKQYLRGRNEIALRNFNIYQKGKSLQQTFTPTELWVEILGKLDRFNLGDLLVIANSELYLTLKAFKEEKYIDYKTIHLLTDIEELQGKDGVIVVDFNNISDLNIDMKFDVVISNPPYQNSAGASRGSSIWHKFVELSVTLLKENGYLNLVHPSAWRAPQGQFKKIQNLLLSMDILYLSLGDYDKGLRVFKVGTAFDFYCIRKSNLNVDTVLEDTKGIIHKLNLKELPFIPNTSLEKVKNLCTNKPEERVKFIFDSSYHSQKKYVKKEKDNEFQYPVVDSITIKNGLKTKYSKIKDKGHFGISKVLLSNGAGAYPIVDSKGEYGLTEFGFAIVDEVSNLENIKTALESTEFIQFMKEALPSQWKYNPKVIGTLKADFWKNFI